MQEQIGNLGEASPEPAHPTTTTSDADMASHRHTSKDRYQTLAVAAGQIIWTIPPNGLAA